MAPLPATISKDPRLMQDIRKDAKNGMDAEALVKKFGQFGLNKTSAAAFVAHATMGRYKRDGGVKSGYKYMAPSMEGPMKRNGQKQMTTTITIRIRSTAPLDIKVDKK